MSSMELSSIFTPGLFKQALSHGLPTDTARLPVARITASSARVVPGTVFVAIAGARHDGWSFVPDAIARGAVAVITDRPEKAQSLPVPVLVVDDAREALALGVSRFLGEPSRQTVCAGVTGTNGKTSVAWMLARLLQRLDGPTMLCGTLGAAVLGEDDTQPALRDVGNTTPGSEDVHELIRGAVSRHAAAAVFEVTSIGLVQHRTTGVHWDVAVFTNLTHDHLDVHATMEAYGDAKARLFVSELVRSEKARRSAVLNVDDPFGLELGRRLADSSEVDIVTYSMSDRDADIVPVRWQPSFSGTDLAVSIRGKEFRMRSQCIGRYNVSNTLAVIGAASALGRDPAQIAEGLASVPPVPGRLEVIPVGEVRCVVDYAHTPDGLIQAQRSLREVCEGRLITVFGCGGDRDRGKRPLMGAAVASLADAAVVTSDNPRSEDPERIIGDIVPGLSGTEVPRAFEWSSEPDRAAAIRRALELARPGDTVLIAGKGHEDYQEVAGERRPFSDQEECRKLAAAREERLMAGDRSAKRDRLFEAD